MDQEKIDLIQSLLLKSVNKVALSEHEQQQLNDWVSEHPLHKGLLDDVSNDEVLHDQFSAYVELVERYQPAPARPKFAVIRILKYASVAAALLVVATSIWYFTKDRSSTPSNNTAQQITTAPTEILPGSNKAILTLADNSRIVLDGQTGQIAQQGDAHIRAANGELTYTQFPDKGTANIGLNMVATPRGSYSYRIVLSDGSVAYLNAESSLKYPPVFGNDSRTVELTGEAYFEIARKFIPGTQEKLPFLVKTATQTIEVLGTRFNVNDYKDHDGYTISTLLEGSIALTAGNGKKLLKPGQRAMLNNSNQQVTIEPTQAEDAILWLKGAFYFADKTPLQQVLKEISRWYDVSYEFDKNIPGDKIMKATLSGSIERNISLGDLLKNVENVVGNNLHLSLRGRTIYIAYAP